MTDEPVMFHVPDAPAIPDRYAGLGHDAARTARQRDLIAAGIHPATRYPLAVGPGLTCGSCTHLYVKPGGYAGGPFRKCDLAKVQQSAGPDLRLSWPACTQYAPTPCELAEATTYNDLAPVHVCTERTHHHG